MSILSKPRADDPTPANDGARAPASRKACASHAERALLVATLSSMREEARSVQPWRHDPAYRHVLVATDFGVSSQRALDLAMNLVEGGEASLTVLHAVERHDRPR